MPTDKLPDFSREGELLPAIAQDAKTGQVLMLAWMNEQAFEETVRSGTAVYYSRSRHRLWHKGEESGHVQKIVEIRVDCDGDAILLLVEQTGVACHEGYLSCFFRTLDAERQPKITLPRTVDPTEAYRKK